MKVLTAPQLIFYLPKTVGESRVFKRAVALALAAVLSFTQLLSLPMIRLRNAGLHDKSNPITDD